MASITLYDTKFKKLPPKRDPDTLLNHLKVAEKRHFPRTEALDFPHELAKRNTSLIAVFSSARPSKNSTEDSSKDSPSKDPQTTETLIAYALYARLSKTALLHKICVVEAYQRQGYGRKLMQEVLRRLESQGCEKVSLWVDQGREAARGLYGALGFQERECVEGYYGVGRSAFRMEVLLGVGV